MAPIQSTTSHDCQIPPPHTRCYLGNDMFGAFKFLQPVSTIATATVSDISPWTSRVACVALALNDICCHMGLGKVYIWSQFGVDEALKSNIRAYAAVCALPDLVYVSEGWDKDEQSAWRRKRPEERLDGMMVVEHVLPSMLVMGIRLEEFGGSNSKIKFSGYTTALVTLAISPSTYIGPTREIRDVLTSTSSAQSLLITEIPSGGNEHSGYLADIRKFRMQPAPNSGRSVIEWLESHSYDLSLLEPFEKMVLCAKEAADTWEHLALLSE